MKGIIFAGCSFTWGQGLYYYSDLKNQVIMGDSNFNQSNVTDAQIKFKNTLHFPRLVANHFNTFELVKQTNGGSDRDSYEFVNSLFDGTLKNHDFILNSNFNYNDFDYMVFQTSQINRNKFKFTFNDINYEITIPNNGMDFLKEEEKILLEWLIKNNLTYNEWFTIFRSQIFEELKNFLILHEERGIKCKIVCWTDDLLEFIKNDEFMSSRLVPLYYNNNKFDTIKYLTDLNNNMLICNDVENISSPPDDHHPSKKCHEIIAESIIKNIEKDNI
jgi:hypothetical protein